MVRAALHPGKRQRIHGVRNDIRRLPLAVLTDAGNAGLYRVASTVEIVPMRNLILAAIIAAAVLTMAGCGGGGASYHGPTITETDEYATLAQSSGAPAGLRAEDMIVATYSDGSVSFTSESLRLDVRGSDGDEINGQRGIVYTLHVNGANLSLDGSDGSSFAWTLGPIPG